MIPIPVGCKVKGLTPVGLSTYGGRYVAYIGYTVIKYGTEKGRFELQSPDGQRTGWFENVYLQSHFIIQKSKITVVLCSRKATK